jgi:hypothetical protein
LSTIGAPRLRHQIDADDLGARKPRHLGYQLPDHPQPEDGYRLPQPDGGVQDTIERRGADVGEDAHDGVEPLGKDAFARRRCVEDGRGSMAPGAIDERAQGKIVNVRSHLDHLAGFLIAPADHGILQVRMRRVGDEETPVCIPALVEVGVGAAIGGELRPGAYPGEQSPHPDLPGLERSFLFICELHTVWSGEGNGPRHSVLPGPV